MGEHLIAEVERDLSIIPTIQMFRLTVSRVASEHDFSEAALLQIIGNGIAFESRSVFACLVAPND
jgi:hypothetical protein